MKVLIACEESQRVCQAFRDRGHEAYSCDMLPCGGGHPEWHIMGDALEVINGCCDFATMDFTLHKIESQWDLIIAHPPCTHLAVSGAAWFDEKQKDGRQQKAIVFFMQMALANCKRLAVENPICIMSSAWREPDQIIEPYQFGDPVRKATCLWLKGLPLLKPTNIVEPELIECNGKHYSGPAWHVKDENGKVLAWNDPMTAKIRSRTYWGIAKAMAEQWG